jgi:hypothetical protein
MDRGRFHSARCYDLAVGDRAQVQRALYGGGVHKWLVSCTHFTKINYSNSRRKHQIRIHRVGRLQLSAGR